MGRLEKHILALSDDITKNTTENKPAISPVDTASFAT